MTRAKGAAGEPGSIVLTGGDARIEVVPTLGGRVRSLQLGGRDWLLPDEGWDERIGGEARPAVREIDLRTDAEGHTLRMVWRGDREAWTLARTLLVRPDGTIEARYEAEATGTERLRIDWGASLTMRLAKRAQVLTPAAATVTVQVEPGRVPLTLNAVGEPAPQCSVQLDREGTRTGKKRGLFSRGPAPAVTVTLSLGGTAEGASPSPTDGWLVPGAPRRWSLTLAVAR